MLRFYMLLFVVHASSLSACVCLDWVRLGLGGALIEKYKGCLLTQLFFSFSYTVRIRAAQLLYISHNDNQYLFQTAIVFRRLSVS